MMEQGNVYGQPEFNWIGTKQDIDRAHKALKNLLSPTATPRDEIIRLSGFSTAVATAALLEMQLNGDVIVEADGGVALGIGF